MKSGLRWRERKGGKRTKKCKKDKKGWRRIARRKKKKAWFLVFLGRVWRMDDRGRNLEGSEIRVWKLERRMKRKIIRAKKKEIDIDVMYLSTTHKKKRKNKERESVWRKQAWVRQVKRGQVPSSQTVNKQSSKDDCNLQDEKTKMSFLPFSHETFSHETTTLMFLPLTSTE